eukprot:4591739-Alexandrium_andersonii.AAC.1
MPRPRPCRALRRSAACGRHRWPANHAWPRPWPDCPPGSPRRCARGPPRCARPSTARCRRAATSGGT